MGGQHGIGGTYQEPITAPVADYNVTGNPNPDCKCNYFLAGTYGGKPYYRRVDGLWFIWFFSSARWAISAVVGTLTLGWAKVINPTIITGDYPGSGGASGTAIVSTGPH